MTARSAWILAGAWLALCVAVVVTGMTLRLSPVEQEMLWPGFIKPLLGPVALVFSALAALLLWIGSGHARGLKLQRPLAEMILFYPLVFAFIWLVLPVHRLRGTDLVIMTLLAGAAAWLVGRPRPGRPAAGPPLTSTLPADLAMILLPVLVGGAIGVKPDFQATGLGFFFYPIFALVQLSLFLIIPASRLTRFGLSRWQTALLCGLSFGLVHAPNPVVMLVTLAAMFIWAWQYLAGRKLWQLAVVMGLSATTFSQFLSDDATAHMRVGPGYLQVRAAEALASAAGTADQRLPRAFLQLIYPRTVGRQASSPELEAWAELIARARRTTMAWQFFTSEEYARRAPEAGWPLPPGEEVHWVQYEPVWRQRILAFGSNEYWARCGGNLTGFAKCLYRDILQRGGSSSEVNSWTRELTHGQRQRLATVLLDHSSQLRNSPFTGMTVAELQLGR